MAIIPDEEQPARDEAGGSPAPLEPTTMKPNEGAGCGLSLLIGVAFLFVLAIMWWLNIAGVAPQDGTDAITYWGGVLLFWTPAIVAAMGCFSLIIATPRRAVIGVGLLTLLIVARLALGTPAPDLALPDTDGRRVALSDFRDAPA